MGGEVGWEVEDGQFALLLRLLLCSSLQPLAEIPLRGLSAGQDAPFSTCMSLQGPIKCPLLLSLLHISWPLYCKAPLKELMI